DLAAWVHRAGGPPLAAGDDVLVAVPLDPGPDIRGVRAGDLGFGHAEAAADLAAQQRAEPAFLLLGGTEQVEDFHVAGVGRGAVEGFRREIDRAAGQLSQRCVIGDREAVVWLVGVREEEVPQTAFACGVLELLDDRRYAVYVPGFDERAALRRIHGFGGVDVAVHERLQAVQVLLGAGARLEVHRRL